MKTKNKKILKRLSAVLATCLLLVALAVPCFADETNSPQYVIQEMVFDNYADLYDFVSQNFHLIYKLVAPGDEMDIVLLPAMITHGNFSDNYIFTCYGLISSSSNTSILANASVTIEETQITFGTTTGVVNSSMVVENVIIPFDQVSNFAVQFYVLTPAELTPAPIDPDAPTRTGLYGELYHIIRDAIYGENALLDSTQEFTLTQIATWMTYIVILLPLVVIAIILFKIFVR